MGFLTRLAAAAGYEKRSTPDPSWAALSTATGFHAGLSARASENLAAVLACVNAISTALGYVPALVYQRDAQGDRIEATAHPLTRLTRVGPNPQMSWPDLVEHLVASVLLTGNALALIERTPGGDLTGLRYAPWSSVTVSELSDGRLAYDVSNARGGVRRYLEGEVIHLRDRTDDGKIGRSRLSRAADTISAVHAANQHAASFLSNGASPSGVIKADANLSPETQKRLLEQWRDAHSGPRNAGRMLLLSGGMSWQSVSLSPEDAELLETRKFGVIEICRLFQVPPPIVQAYENNTFTNAAQAGLWFATFCLAPWARKIEAEFARSVFPSNADYELELDLSGFLRGDPETRWNTHKIAIETGVLDPDEVRQLEGWNARRQSNRMQET